MQKPKPQKLDLSIFGDFPENRKTVRLVGKYCPALSDSELRLIKRHDELVHEMYEHIKGEPVPWFMNRISQRAVAQLIAERGGSKKHRGRPRDLETRQRARKLLDEDEDKNRKAIAFTLGKSVDALRKLMKRSAKKIDTTERFEDRFPEQARQSESEPGTMTPADMKSLKVGDTLVFNDGRYGQRGVKVAVLSNRENYVVVQFEDRADTTAIKHDDAAWVRWMTQLIQKDGKPVKALKPVPPMLPC